MIHRHILSLCCVTIKADICIYNNNREALDHSLSRQIMISRYVQDMSTTLIDAYQNCQPKDVLSSTCSTFQAESGSDPAACLTSNHLQTKLPAKFWSYELKADTLHGFCTKTLHESCINTLHPMHWQFRPLQQLYKVYRDPCCPVVNTEHVKYAADILFSPIGNRTTVSTPSCIR